MTIRKGSGFGLEKFEESIRGMSLTDVMSPEHRNDKLHPELQAHYRKKSGSLGVSVIRHPLLVTIVPYAALCNKQFVTKRDRYEQALRERDWGMVFYLLERPFRLEYLMRFYWEKKFKHGTFRKLFPELWADAEFGKRGAIVDGWLTCWKIAHHGKLITDGKRLPRGDKFLIYRGVHSKRKWKGMSWTLDKKTAEFFAGRFTRGNGYVAHGWVKREDVLAYLTGRGESEIIVDPARVQIDGFYETHRERVVIQRACPQVQEEEQ